MHPERADPTPHVEPVAGQHDRAVLLALCVTAFMAALNFFATSPFYPDMSDDLNTTVPLLGQVATVMILISALLGLAVGPLADRYGFARPLTLGIVAIAVNLVGTSLAPSVPVLFALSVTGGLADALVFGLAFAVAGTYFHGAARLKAIGWTSGSLSIAPVLGVPILTFVGDLTSWRVALFSGGVVAAGAAWFVWRSLPRTETAHDTRLRMRDMIDPYRPLLRDRPTLALYAINILRGITWLGWVTYTGGFLEHEFGLETREIGLVYMLSGLGYAVGGFSRRPVLPGSLIMITAVTSIASALGVGIVVLSESLAVLIVVLPVASFLASRCGIALNTLVAARHQTGAGTAIVLNGSVFNLAAALGALLGGIAIGIGGYVALGIVAPAFGLLGGWLALQTARQGGFAGQ